MTWKKRGLEPKHKKRPKITIGKILNFVTTSPSLPPSPLAPPHHHHHHHHHHNHNHHQQQSTH
uniref:Uncharacterized protein n=1 Tax=Glossina brevipalpis TaxID=37001 RepID=A0A1A9WMZ2_9MUSC